MSEYLRTDLWIDAVTSLEAAQDFCAQVTINELHWKWVLMAVHSAVQGFMALALEHGNGLLVMKNREAKKWIEAYEAGEQYHDAQMDFFLSLYNKVKTDVVACYIGSKKFVPGATHDSSMNKLNELRNGFVHFMPKGWSIEVAGLPVICLDSLDLVYFLACESGTILWHDEDLSRRAVTALTSLRAELTAIGSICNP